MATVDPAGSAPADVLADAERRASAARLLVDLPGRDPYDRLARLAARLVDAPAALVCLVTDEEHLIGSAGLPDGFPPPLPLDGSPCALAVSLGVPVVAPDARAHEQLSALPAVADGRLAAYLGVPLTASSGSVVGALSVFGGAVRKFTDDDVTMLEQLAASVIAELELSSANAALLTSLGRLDVALQASQVGIWDVDLASGVIEWDQRCAAVFGLDTAVQLPSVEEVLTHHVHPDDHELINEAMSAAIQSRGQYLVEARAVHPDGTVRWFVARGRVIVGPDGDAERMFGTVLDASEARAQAQERLLAVQRAAAVAEVAVELANATRLEELIEITVRAAQSLGASMGGLAVLEEGGSLALYLDRRLSEAVVAQRGNEIPAQGVPLPLDDALPAQYVARTGERVLLRDQHEAAARFPDMARIAAVYGAQALATLPLRVEGLVLGSFTVVWPGRHDFSSDELETLEALSAQIALTLSRLRADSDRATAVAAMTQANRRLQLLADVGRVLSGSLDIDSQVEQLAELVVPELGDWCWIVVTEEQGRLYGLASAHRDPTRRAELAAYVRTMVAVMTEQAGARVVARTGHPVVVEHVDWSHLGQALPDATAHEMLHRLGLGSSAIVPLVARGEVLGALGLFNVTDRGPHSAAEVDTAVEVGRRAGMALHNARLFGQQRDLADALQRSMLTAPPQPDHCEIVVRYVPAAAGAEIGGDWYDAFLQPGGATVLAIGDVVGHDTHAAAAMGQVRGLLRGISYSSGGTPAEVLTGLDRALRGLTLDIMATALVARLEREEPEASTGTVRFRWSNAGHPPPLVLSPDGKVSVLEGPVADLLLGVSPNVPREDRVAVLERGSTVLLYTDGLVERRDRDIDAGTAELVDVLGASAGLPLEALCDQILERLFLPDAEDDVAVLAVRLHEE